VATNFFLKIKKTLRLALLIEALFSYRTKGQKKILETTLTGKDTYPPSPNTRFGLSLIKINIDLNNTEDTLEKHDTRKNDKIYINLKALDKITAKTSAIRLAVGETNFFGSLEIKALKCQLSENNDLMDTVAYLQVKDLSTKDNNQVFLFNGWTFASSPTLQSIDHPIYDLWIISCENI